jgi:hypothetical protein
MFKKKDIQKIHKLSAEYDELKQLSSDQLKAVQDKGKDLKLKVTRKTEQGENITEDSEKLLWVEVFHLGKKCDAAIALKEKYPGVFKVSDDCDQKAEELNSFVREKFGFNFREMGISEYIKLTEGLIDLKLQELTNNK